MRIPHPETRKLRRFSGDRSLAAQENGDGAPKDPVPP